MRLNDQLSFEAMREEHSCLCTCIAISSPDFCRPEFPCGGLVLWQGMQMFSSESPAPPPKDSTWEVKFWVLWGFSVQCRYLICWGGGGEIIGGPQNFPTPNKENTLHYRGLLFIYLFLVFQHRVSLCSPSCLETALAVDQSDLVLADPPGEPGSKACATAARQG